MRVSVLLFKSSKHVLREHSVFVQTEYLKLLFLKVCVIILVYKKQR